MPLSNDVYDQRESLYAKQNALSVGQVEAPSIRHNLEQQKIAIVQRLKNIEAAIDFLDKNPSFEEFNDLIKRIY